MIFLQILLLNQGTALKHPYLKCCCLQIRPLFHEILNMESLWTFAFYSIIYGNGLDGMILDGMPVTLDFCLQLHQRWQALLTICIVPVFATRGVVRAAFVLKKQTSWWKTLEGPSKNIVRQSVCKNKEI